MSIVLRSAQIGKDLKEDNNDHYLLCYGQDPLPSNDGWDDGVSEDSIIVEGAGPYDVGGFTSSTGVVAAVMWVNNDGDDDENTTLYIKLFKGDDELDSVDIGVSIPANGGWGRGAVRFTLGSGLTEDGDDYRIEFYHLGTKLEDRTFSITGAEADIRLEQLTVGTRLHNQYVDTLMEVSGRDWYVKISDIFDGGWSLDEPVIAEGSTDVDIGNHYYKTYSYAFAIFWKNYGSGTGYKGYRLSIEDPDGDIAYEWGSVFTVGVGGGSGSALVDAVYLTNEFSKNGTYTIYMKDEAGNVEGSVDFTISGYNNSLNAGTAGFTRVDGEYIYYNDRNGHKHRISNDGTSSDVAEGKTGSIWVDYDQNGKLGYISESNKKRFTSVGNNIEGVGTEYEGFVYANDDNTGTVFNNSFNLSGNNYPYQERLILIAENGDKYGILNGNN